MWNLTSTLEVHDATAEAQRAMAADVATLEKIAEREQHAAIARVANIAIRREIGPPGNGGNPNIDMLMYFKMLARQKNWRALAYQPLDLGTATFAAPFPVTKAYHDDHCLEEADGGTGEEPCVRGVNCEAFVLFDDDVYGKPYTGKRFICKKYISPTEWARFRSRGVSS